MVKWKDLFKIGDKKEKNKQQVEELMGVKIVAQEWLDKNYPQGECINRWGEKVSRSEVEKIHLTEPSLEGELDLGDFTDLWRVYISPQVDESKLVFKNQGEEVEIIKLINAQEWLEQNYPKNGVCQRESEGIDIKKYGYGKTRKEITRLDISKQNLAGSLDCSGFINLIELWCNDNQLTSLKLTNLVQLEQLWCSDNNLTNLNFLHDLNPEQLAYLNVKNNNFSPQDLTIFNRFVNLEILWIGNNYNQDKINQGIYNHFTGTLQPLQNLSKLQSLDIDNTDLDSGWEYLPASLESFTYDTDRRPDCKLVEIKEQLDQKYWADIHQRFTPKWKKEWLDQGFSKEQTKEWIVAGANHNSAKFIDWFLNFRKLDLAWAKENEEEFKNWRDSYHNFGTCQQCQQPNTSKDWCQSCNAQHFQSEFNNWTSGNPNIDQFIQKFQLEATSTWNLLEWIPYEKFNNIEHIADGGFGQVHKAEWEGGSIKKWDNEKKGWKRNGDWNDEKEKYKDYKTVALKTLSNSQNLTQPFLQELTLYKMFKSEVSQMVPCYGVSRDREGNYIMVMEYMWDGNLREYLRKNRELDLWYKLNFLQQIIQGLKDIHRKGLVHRDFHSGNIIVDKRLENRSEKIFCSITDLGLAKPVDEKDDNKIFGVLPYVAPEVLRGQPYTQKSDIYSFGIIMYEILTGCPPFANESHDVNLSLAICLGERPQFPKQIKYPQLLVDLIKRCWDNEPNNRPTAREVSGIVGEWFEESSWKLKSDTEFYYQYQEADAYNFCQALTKLYQQYHGQIIENKPEKIEEIGKQLYSEFCQKNNYEKNSDEEYPEEATNEFIKLLYSQSDIKINEGTVWHSKPINTQQITHLLKTKEQFWGSRNIDLDLNNFNLDELNLINDQEQCQTQIEIPPKK